MKPTWLAILNCAAGGGRCGRLAAGEIDKLRAADINVDTVETTGPGHATEIVRSAYRTGQRHFIAVGGDGTSCEIVNGLFPECLEGPRPTLAFLPLGTGNSFLRDFTTEGASYAREALIEGRHRSCDVLCLHHDKGSIHFINLLSIGFSADVAAMTNRRFKRLGRLGYLLGILVGLVRLRRRAFPHRLDNDTAWDRRKCLFLSFNNSQYTGGKMLISNHAATDDGLIEYVRWGPAGRWVLMRNLRRLYDGTHLDHPQAGRRAVRQVSFDLPDPIDVMIDGEVMHVRCTSLEILPGALDVVV